MKESQSVDSQEDAMAQGDCRATEQEEYTDPSPAVDSGSLVEDSAPLGESEAAEEESHEVELSENENEDPSCSEFDAESHYVQLEEKLDSLVELFRTRIARSDYEDKMLKQYSDEIQQYRNDLYKKITLPLLGELVELRGMMCSSISRAYEEDPNCVSVNIGLLETYRDMVETSLGNYGVELLSPSIGDDPVPGVTKTVGKTKTGDEDLHGKLSKVMGDAYLLDGKCISPAKVKVYVFDQEMVECESDGAVDSSPAEEDVAVHSSCCSSESGSEAQRKNPQSNSCASGVPVYDPED